MSSFNKLCRMIIWIYILVIIIVAILIATNVNAQNVTRKGNVFVQIDSSHVKKGNPILTKYMYIDKNGNKFPIYMSVSGKCFIIRKSGKTGKEYKQYLPEITKQLHEKN